MSIHPLPKTKQNKLFILWQMNTLNTIPGPQGHTQLHSSFNRTAPFPDAGESQDPTSFPQIQGPFSFFNNPLEIRTQVSYLAQPCRRDPASVLHPWGRQVSGLLALEDDSIVSPCCRLDCQKGLGQDQGFSYLGSPAETILPSQTLLPCAQVSSCHPEAGLRPGSPGICMAVAQEWAGE